MASNDSKTIFLTHNLGENLGRTDLMTADFIPDSLKIMPRNSHRQSGKKDRTYSLQEPPKKNKTLAPIVINETNNQDYPLTTLNEKKS